MRRIVTLSIMVLLLAGLLLVAACGKPRSLTPRSSTPSPSTPRPTGATKSTQPASRQTDSPPTEAVAPKKYEHVTPRDADAYFEANSKILSVKPAKESDAVFTEAEINKELARRGFNEYSITFEYSMDGEYSEETEISSSSSTHHPVYSSYYITGSEEMWVILVVDGLIHAIPVSYNFESDLDVQVIFSETEAVMSYDSATNQFYETIPNESELIVNIVDRIDTDTLESLSTEVIDSL